MARRPRRDSGNTPSSLTVRIRSIPRSGYGWKPRWSAGFRVVGPEDSGRCCTARLVRPGGWKLWRETRRYPSPGVKSQSSIRGRPRRMWILPTTPGRRALLQKIAGSSKEKGINFHPIAYRDRPDCPGPFQGGGELFSDDRDMAPAQTDGKNRRPQGNHPQDLPEWSGPTKDQTGAQ